MFLPNVRQALRLLRAYVPAPCAGPEHFTFGVLQGVL